MNNFSHIPVLLEEGVEALNVRPNGRYVDATLGGGGHTSLILQKGGIVLGIDQDQDALDYVSESQSLAIENKKLVLAKGNFRDIRILANENGFTNIDGVLFDFGVSSYQLDKSGRGFSIKNDERLDMRMDKSQDFSAFDVVNSYPRGQLVEIFYKYGEEHNAEKIATEIVERRKKKEIATTGELKDLIERIGHKNENIHPATRVFQAIRIEVNGELSAIETGLKDSLSLLKPNGRIVAISFHSLEDRIVKRLFDQFKKEGMGFTVTKKPIPPSDTELMKNRRARSAKMRIFEKN